MSIDDFLAATAERMPTAAELVGLCRSLGWRLGKGVIAGAATGDPLAKAVANFVRREPWRSEVLTLVAESPDPKPPAPLPADRAAGLTAADPHNCRECRALVLAVPDEVTGAFCESPTCPYRGRTGSTSSPGSRAT